MTAITSQPLSFTWTDPTTNTDGSPITAGEVTGYTIGIRNTATAGSVAGTYPITVSAPGASVASIAASGAAASLAPGTYAAAIQTNGPVNSPWSPEVTFTIAMPTPNAPANFLVV